MSSGEAHCAEDKMSPAQYFPQSACRAKRTQGGRAPVSWESQGGGRSSRKGLQLLPVQVSKQFQVIMSLSEEFEWKRKAIFWGNISPVCPPFRTSCFFRTESETWGLFLVLPTDSWVTSVTSSLRMFRVPLFEKNFKISFQSEL